jgi:guanylate kinase
VAQLDARPLLIVVSGPSGSGKGTALSHATRVLPLRRIPTYTTRPMRSGEQNGVDYEYVDEQKFLELREAGAIFEYTRTYSRSYYGSPSVLLHDDVQDPLIVELDPNGFVRVRAASARRVVGIFVATSSESELRARLTARSQDPDIGERLKISTDQMAWAWIYDYVLFNADREEFLDDVTATIKSELLRTSGARQMLDLRQEMDPTLTEAPPDDRKIMP